MDKNILLKTSYPKYLNEQINKENIENYNRESWYKKGEFGGYIPLDIEEFYEKLSSDNKFLESMILLIKGN